jgi:hypothetical protein
VQSKWLNDEAEAIGGPGKLPRLEDDEEWTTMWVNMYRLRVGQRLRQLAVLTAVGAALNMGGVQDSATTTQAATVIEPSSEQWLQAPAVGAIPEAPQALPDPTHAWPRKHRSRAELEARMERLEQIRREMEEAHSDLRACIAASREARAETTNAAAAASAVRSAAAVAAAAAGAVPVVRVVAIGLPRAKGTAHGEWAVVERSSCARRATTVTRTSSSGVRELAVVAMTP